MSSSQCGQLADYSALEGRLAPSASALPKSRIVRRVYDLRASYLQSYEWPHGGPADTLRTSHRADYGPPWLPASPSVVSEATADEKLVASSESAAVAFDTTT